MRFDTIREAAEAWVQSFNAMAVNRLEGNCYGREMSLIASIRDG